MAISASVVFGIIVYIGVSLYTIQNNFFGMISNDEVESLLSYMMILYGNVLISKGFLDGVGVKVSNMVYFMAMVMITAMLLLIGSVKNGYIGVSTETITYIGLFLIFSAVFLYFNFREKVTGFLANVDSASKTPIKVSPSVPLIIGLLLVNVLQVFISKYVIGKDGNIFEVVSKSYPNSLRKEKNLKIDKSVDDGNYSLMFSVYVEPTQLTEQMEPSSIFKLRTKDKVKILSVKLSPITSSIIVLNDNTDDELSIPIKFNVWNRMVINNDNGVMRVYNNGDLIKTGICGLDKIHVYKAKVGSERISSFNGLIKNVYLFTRKLSVKELDNIVNI